MKEILKLRRLLIDIYDYQARTPDSMNGVVEEDVIKFLMDRYNGTYNKVKLRMLELRKEDLIKDVTNNEEGGKKIEITSLGYKVKRSWINALQLAVNSARYVWLTITIGFLLLLVIILFN